MRNIVFLFSLFMFNSCIMPMSPRYDHYRTGDASKNIFLDHYGYIYQNEDTILTLWVHSTPWKAIYLSTNVPILDSMKIQKNNGSEFYLKKMSNEQVNELPRSIYHNDSVHVYSETLRLKDNRWYSKKVRPRSDTLTVTVNSKNYQFVLSQK